MDVYHSLRQNVLDYLRQFAGEEILFYPNPGNGGDSLIQVGTYAAFEAAGLNVQDIGLEDEVRNKVVILGGGGNYISLYNNIREAMDRFRDRAAKIILLPHTMRDNVDHLPYLDEKFVLFCRDPISYLHVVQYNNKAEVYISHDMAFHIDGAALLNNEAIREAAEPVFEDALRAHGIDAEAICRQEEANFNRLDWESQHQHPNSFADLSEMFKFGIGADEARISSWCMVKAVSLARSIITDRLHVGIAACLMSKPCRLGDNNYNKIGSIYAHSIRNRFPMVTYQSQPPINYDFLRPANAW